MSKYSSIFSSCFFLVCFSQQPFDDQDFLDAAKQHSLFEQQRKKNFSLVKEKIKPRGISPDGRFAVFEKRSILRPHLIEFIVFDASFGTRNIFLAPAQKNLRQNVLLSIQKDTQYIENTISLFQNINQTKTNLSFTYADVFLEIYRESATQNLLLDIWKVLPLQKRQLFCRYPISNSPFVSGKIEKVYSFDNNHAFAVQIVFQKSNQVFLDILSFHLEKGFSVLASEQLAKQSFVLSLKDRNQVFLKDIFFSLDDPQRIEKQKIYFLGGLSKESFPKNLFRTN